jgi:hypothetical protein
MYEQIMMALPDETAKASMATRARAIAARAIVSFGGLDEGPNGD